MAITKNNINVNQMPVNNSPGIPGMKKNLPKTIRIHKSYDDAMEYASRIIMPTAALEYVYYKDAEKNILCLLVIGNVPNNPPIVFTGISAIKSEVLDDMEETATNTATTIIDDKTKWNEYTENSSTSDTSTEDIEWTDYTDVSSGGWIDVDSSSNINWYDADSGNVIVIEEDEIDNTGNVDSSTSITIPVTNSSTTTSASSANTNTASSTNINTTSTASATTSSTSVDTTSTTTVNSDASDDGEVEWNDF